MNFNKLVNNIVQAPKLKQCSQCKQHVNKVTAIYLTDYYETCGYYADVCDPCIDYINDMGYYVTSENEE